MTTESLRYPIGRFTPPRTITAEDRQQYIAEIESLPQHMREVVEGLSEEQLNTPYRENGWTIRQLIHHVPDSHINSYVRFKLALTEDQPTIKPYFEDRWATLSDTQDTPVSVSLNLLEALHLRWVNLLKKMQEEDWTRSFIHPEHTQPVRLEMALAIYAWHGKHHLAHIQSLKERMKW